MQLYLFWKKNTIYWFKNSVQNILKCFINNEILKTQIVTLLYSFFFTAQNHTLNINWINNYIQAEFLKLVLNSNDKLTEIMKKIIIHSLCNKLNLLLLCMKFNKYNCIICSKKYLWQLQSHIIVNENRYLIYWWSENKHCVIKWVNDVEIIIFNE